MKKLHNFTYKDTDELIRKATKIGLKQLDRIERLLKWLVAEQVHTDKDVVDEMRLKAECNQPDIMDILEEGDEERRKDS